MRSSYRTHSHLEDCNIAAILAMLIPLVVASGEWTTGTYVTGYWDCCKPSCSWPGKGNVNQPVRMCDATSGATMNDPSAASVCGGGRAASCTNQQPWIVHEGLSMGFAAAAVGGPHGLQGDSNCGQCYELQFVDTIHDPWSWGGWGGAHAELVGKMHVVQVTNIGYDVNGRHSFDLQIPGAGQGAFSDGCYRQFPGYSSGAFDCNVNYGGCKDISGCSRLPQVLQRGCEWRFKWFKWLVANGQSNNPYIRFRRVRCPIELTDLTGSVPLDDHLYPVHTGATNVSRTTTNGFLPPSSTTTAAGNGRCSDYEVNCQETKCCTSSSMQCYKKDQHWAACLSSCSPGQVRMEDPPQYRTPWSCDILGTPPTTNRPTQGPPVDNCAYEGVDCRSVGCCKSPNMQCYEKDSWWGECLESCTPGIHWDDAPQHRTPWSCNLVGEITTTATTPIPPTTTTAAANAHCSHAEASCQETKCCRSSSMQCYKKDQYWAACLSSCSPGQVRMEDPPQYRTPWSCDILGTPPTTNRPTQGPPVDNCAHEDVDCRSVGCCKSPNMQCYEKDSWWGECLESCTPGIHWDDAPQYRTPWSCNLVGESTTTTTLPPWCSEHEMDCRSSLCCKDSWMKCYRKDDFWAACLSHCNPGRIRWEDPPQYRTPWSCDVLR